MPAVGAMPLRISVPTAVVPPTTDAGEIVRLVRVTGLIVRVTAIDVDPADAVILAGVDEVTAFVVIENVADDVPPGTVTVAGAAAEVELDLRVTLKPAGGAFPPSVNVPTEDLPPVTLVGAIVNKVRAIGFTVRTAVTFAPPSDAVIVIFVDAVTDPVTKLIVATFEPAGTVTDPGPPHAGDVDVKVTLLPPDGAAELILTVPVTDPPS